MKKIYRVISIVIILCLISLLFACSKNTTDTSVATESSETDATTSAEDSNELENPNVSFLYWSGTEISQEFKDQIANFEEEYSAKVNLDNVPWGEWQTKFIASMASGDAYDVAPLMEYYFPNFAIKSVVQPIESFIDVNDPMWNTSVIERYSWKDVVYGVGTGYGPLVVSPYVIFYNKTMFENNGVKTPSEYYAEGEWNFDNFRKAGKILTQDTDKDGNIDQWGYATWVFDQWPIANGAELIKMNSAGGIDVNIEDQKVIDALQVQQDTTLLDNFVMPDGPTKWSTDFLAGKIAMIMERPYVVEWYDFKSNMIDEWDVVPFPFGPGNTEKTFVGDIQGMGITTGANNPKGAAAFIESVSKFAMESASGNMAGYTSEQTALLMEASKKVVSPKTYGLANWSGQYINMLNELNEGTPASTVVAKYAPLLKNEVDTVLADSGEYEIEIFAGIPAIDFETEDIFAEKSEDCVSKSISITTDAEEVIGGNASLKIEVDPENNGWVWHVRCVLEKAKVPAFHIYNVSFDYKVLSDFADDGMLYIQIKAVDGSAAHGWVTSAAGLKAGDTGKMEGIIGVSGKYNDNVLYIGGVNVADYVVDNITIEEK